MLFDPEGRIVAANKAADSLAGRPLAGLTNDEVVRIFRHRRPDGTLLGAGDLPSARVRAGETGDTVEVPLVITAADGRTLEIVGTASPIVERCTVTGVLVVWRDVTAQKRAEKELRESEEKYRGILETAEEGIATHEPDGTITYVNQRMADMLGYSRDEIVGRSSLDFVDDEEKEKVIRARQGLEAHGSFSRERKMRRKDGSTLWTLANVTPRRDGAGTFTGYLAMHTDITRHRQAEEALRESEAKYREIFESMGEGFALHEVVLDDAGVPVDYQFLALNPAFEAMTGYSSAAIVGRTAREVHPDLEPWCIEHYGRVATTGEPVRFEACFPPIGRWYDVHAYSPAPGRFASVFSDVTERKRAEDSLRQSQRDYQALLDHSMLSYARCRTLFDDNGTPNDYEVVEVNEAYRAMTGFSDPVGRRISEIVPGMEPNVIDFHNEVAVSGISRQTDVYSGPLDRWYQVNVYSPAPGECVALSRDITDRVRTEEALRETRDYLDSLIDHANAPIVVWDPAFRITRFNAAFEHLSGYAADQVIGRDLAVLFPEVSREESLEKIQRTIIEQWESVEIPILHRDGGVRIALWNSATIFDREGTTLLATIAQGQDITKRKEAERALQESEERYRELVEQAGSIILRYDRDGRLTFTNTFAQRFFGFSVGELLGEAAIGTIIPETETSTGRDLAVMVGGIVQSPDTYAENENITKDGQRIWVRWANRPIVGPDGEIREFLAIGTDITGRKKAEAALQEYAEDLRRSNEDLERYAYVSSHDLQEPLRSIVSFSQLLERKYRGRLDSDADEYIKFIVEGGNRMQALILDLLAYSRLNTRAQELRLIDVEAVMAAVERHLDGQIREAGAILTYDPLPTVEADPLQLELVFENLVSNAIKFRRPDEPLRIHIGARSLDGVWEFSVTDNGIGIEPEYFDRIFVIFQRLHTRDVYPGTGIGLAIVKRIVDRHGGTVRVESTPGEGTTFFFTLPAA
jgi:PAS domain S-box-containing protein